MFNVLFFCIYVIRKNMKDLKGVGEINMYVLQDLEKFFIDLKMLRLVYLEKYFIIFVII